MIHRGDEATFMVGDAQRFSLSGHILDGQSGQFHREASQSLPGDGSRGSFGKPQVVHSEVSVLEVGSMEVESGSGAVASAAALSSPLWQTAEHEPPRVEARAIRSPSTGVWCLLVICPFCWKRHMHGGGDDSEPFYGYRVSECLIGGRDYDLIPEIEKGE